MSDAPRSPNTSTETLTGFLTFGVREKMASEIRSDFHRLAGIKPTVSWDKESGLNIVTKQERVEQVRSEPVRITPSRNWNPTSKSISDGDTSSYFFGQVRDYRSKGVEFPTRADTTIPAVVSCPSCYSRMIIRLRHSDQSPFWGCTKYPGCRGIRGIGPENIEEAKQWAGSTSCKDQSESYNVQTDYNIWRGTKGLGVVGAYYAESPFIAPTRIESETLTSSWCRKAACAYISRLDALAGVEVTPEVFTTITELVRDVYKFRASHSEVFANEIGKELTEIGKELNKSLIRAEFVIRKFTSKAASVAKEMVNNKTMIANHTKSAKVSYSEASDGCDDEKVCEDSSSYPAYPKARRESIGENLARRMKRSARRAPVRMVRMQALTQGKDLLLSALEPHIEESSFGIVKAVLESDAGSGAVLGLLGMVGPHVPKVGRDPRVMAICDEFLDEGTAKGLNQVVTLLTGILKPVFETMAEKLPPISEVAEAVKSKRAVRKGGKKRIATTPAKKSRAVTASIADEEIEIEEEPYLEATQ